MSSSRLLSLLTNDLRAAWEGLRRARPTDAFYVFGLYSTEEVAYLTVTASSQEGLSEVARQYVARTGEDFAHLVHQLRWSPCDSPLHAPDDADFGASSQEVERLRAEGAAPEEILDVAVDALRALDGEGVFGPAATRELVLGIWFGDQSDESRLDFVQRLNPPAVAERFRRESQLACVWSAGTRGSRGLLPSSR